MTKEVVRMIQWFVLIVCLWTGASWAQFLQSSDILARFPGLNITENTSPWHQFSFKPHPIQVYWRFLRNLSSSANPSEPIVWQESNSSTASMMEFVMNADINQGWYAIGLGTVVEIILKCL
jgi:hypothetical protein